MLPDFHRRPVIRLPGASILYLELICKEREVSAQQEANTDSIIMQRNRQLFPSLRSQRIVLAVELNNILTISLAKKPQTWMSWHKLLYQLKALQRFPFHNVKPQRAALRKPAVAELKFDPQTPVLCSFYVCDSHWHQLKSHAHEESRISDKKKSTMWIWEQNIILLCQIMAPSGNIKRILVTIRAESINWNK